MRFVFRFVGVVALLVGFVFSPLMARDETVLAAGPEGEGEGETEKAQTWIDTYDALLRKYVTGSGVNYAAWHGSAADRAALLTVIAGIGGANLTGATREEKLAFLINAYNAWILHHILRDYPVKGPGGGGFFGRNSFFKSKDLKVDGSAISFHALENEVIRPTFKEPRVHFALNCASKSCPPLHPRAFRAETLDATLDQLASAFINDNRNGVITEKGGAKLRVSKIFDWYEDDFPGGVVALLNKYRRPKFSANAKVSFQTYDWSLNEVR